MSPEKAQKFKRVAAAMTAADSGQSPEADPSAALGRAFDNDGGGAHFTVTFK